MRKSIDPEIKQGYWARVRAIEMIVEQFIEVGVCRLSREQLEPFVQKTNGTGQILSVGCGFDTLYFRLVAAKRADVQKYVEVWCCFFGGRKYSRALLDGLLVGDDKEDRYDYATKWKSAQGDARREEWCVEKNEMSGSAKAILAGAPVQVASSRCDMHAPPYHLLGADLRQEKELETKLDAAGIDYRCGLKNAFGKVRSFAYSAPTLIIAECVFVYMANDATLNLLKFFTQRFTQCAIVNYDQVRLYDLLHT